MKKYRLFELTVQLNSSCLGWAGGVAQLGPQFQPAVPHFSGDIWIACFRGYRTSCTSNYL